ncbi:MAG: DUF2779 domain-containing protein [Bacilli bacterium]|nr:DUF2779 domain-containing protein [Bacilli bacterium]
MNFSKSKYCGLWQCPKIVWLKKYKPDEYVVDESVKTRMETGNKVGDLAMTIFGDFVEVTEAQEDKLDIPAMIEKTKEFINNGVNNICEASFEYNGLYCAVDILKKEKDGYSIHEVKSSTHEDNYIYLVDVAYQKYVLEKYGVKIYNTYLINIDSDYIYNGSLELDKLFKITDVTNLVFDEYSKVEDMIKEAEKMLNSKEEPSHDICTNCHYPYKCGFWKYCSRHLPKPSVFDIYRLPFQKKLEYYNRNIISFKDIENTGWFLGPIQNRQIEYALYDKGIHADKKGIKNFLSTLSYPLYFLDFETIQPVIPEFIGTKPYQQIPFQYSLHIIEKEGGPLIHKEFLAESGQDPRRAIAESLCNNIPEYVCCLAFNKGFECGRLGELADSFPDLRQHLINIELNMKDLLDPFRMGNYYCKEIGGSFSIKSVLPAMFPDDPELNYHNLDEIHNGGEAMSVFPKIKDLPLAEQEKTRHNLLKYCELDTYAMVKIWQELVKIVNN